MLRFVETIINSKPTAVPNTHGAKKLLMLSNLLMLLGLILLLYVGGIYANAEYGRYAARGDTDVPAPEAVAPQVSAPMISLRSIPFLPQEAAPVEPAPFTPPVADASVAPGAATGRVTSLLPDAAPVTHKNSITRIIIPRIDVDSKVVAVGWEVQELNGQQVALWQVAEYAVGHHVGSANPGEPDNIVLAGHVGGYGKVFRDLVKLEPGDRMLIYSAGQIYQYIVSEKVIVNEEGVSAEQQAENARYIAPSDTEQVTLVTCWPATGPNRFTQRVIVRAIPVAEDSTRG